MATFNIKTNNYNIGALSGKYALKDLSNTGKFSNMVDTLPFKVVLNISEDSGQITLKQGSLVAVPNGLSDADGVSKVDLYERINKDVTISIGHRINDPSTSATTTNKVYLIYNSAAGMLEADNNIMYKYYTENVYEGGVLKYEGNTFLRVAAKQKCALPLGYFDDAWHFHQFTAIGFYKDFMWVDSGTAYYVPNGRDDGYGLNIDTITINNLVYTTIDELKSGVVSDSTATGYLLLDKYGKGHLVQNYKSSVVYTPYVGYEYVSSDNYIYDSGKNKVIMCKVSDMSIAEDEFDSISNFNTYQTVDYAEVLGNLASIEETMVHKNGGNETVLGDKAFSGLSTFSNILINGGNISNCTVTGNLKIADSKTITFTDAVLTSVNRTNHPNCLKIQGKTDNTKGGITLGKNSSVKILGSENDANITITLPTNKKDSNNNDIVPTILPAATDRYDLGATGRKFRNMYATTFNGNATSSNWADLAEIYATDKEYPVGTLLQFGGKAELTIASSEVNAVVSERPGFLLNAEGEGQPVALAGRVRVRVNGPVKKFDKIFLSNKDGIGTTVGLLDEKPIARALEDKPEDGEGLVLCCIHFTL